MLTFCLIGIGICLALALAHIANVQDEGKALQPPARDVGELLLENGVHPGADK